LFLIYVYCKSKNLSDKNRLKHILSGNTPVKVGGKMLGLKILKTITGVVWVVDIVMIVLMLSFLYMF